MAFTRPETLDSLRIYASPDDIEKIAAFVAMVQRTSTFKVTSSRWNQKETFDELCFAANALYVITRKHLNNLKQ